MANTYSQIYIHFVFSVKYREKLIHSSWEERLHKFITGLVTNKGHKLIAINGMPDHIHILIGLKPCDISALVREIKKSSNAFIKENRFCSKLFQWQEGYGAFSYHHSMLDRIIKYIENQKAHHEKVSVEEEYRSFLDAYQVDYDEKYLFND